MTRAEVQTPSLPTPSAIAFGRSSDGIERCAPSVYTVKFIPVLRHADNPLLVMLHRLYEDDVVIAETELWRRELSSSSDGRRMIRWMQQCSHKWQSWGWLSFLFGPEQLMEWIDGQVIVERARRLESIRHQRIEKSRERERMARQREKEHIVDSYLVDDEDNRLFGIDLRRGRKRKGFFVIWFRERWERERFRDWWRCQRSRFPEFVSFLEVHGPGALERRLLQEMLTTEKKVKQAGMSAGGRRPLRFYRGED